ncbi:autotransporter outer membrane beta-barrel domain-containing protein [Pseudomonas nunensis]|uniref:Autotransporter domain-containing protein n=1 Tax=Pseudomonas nunensis TaxID=2961896 RepID=A0ABY5EFB0_9PSED|nr:autotransporter outer membrane beta-barrel domain-containing protein [Pseudomonas nunensis]KOY01992.1 transporter [Pseudomonas nunensis]KPN88403.1 transporter [Pseudomonas nunensis]MCL5225948.1 autotransporter domain-containing protein [Pseudomonas nunensis]UTO13931.1 autotransporter domain-containing protein [Pseudomonas nunensis]
MSDQHTFRPKHLTLAIALALGCAEFTNAQDLSTHTESPARAEVLTNAELKSTPLEILQQFTAAGSTVPLEINTPDMVIKGTDADDLFILKNGGSFKGLADGGEGDNVIHLDASAGGVLGDTQNFEGLFNSQGAWTLTSKGDFKEGVVVLNDGILTNNGKILGRAIAVGQLFNKGEIVGAVDVADGGTFAGSGTVGSLKVHGLLSVNKMHGAPRIKGDLNLTETGVLAYEVNPDGRGETIKVAGTASLGGSTLKIVAVPGEYPQSSRYTLIEANEVEGKFGKVLNDLAFMTPAVRYNKKSVGLTYARNEVPIESLATSDNGREFAKNIDEPQTAPQAQEASESTNTAVAQVAPTSSADASAAQPSTVAEISGAAPKPSTTTNASASAQKPPTTTNAAVDALLASNKQTASLALEQLAGSSNANLAKATLSSVDPVSGSLLSAMRQLDNTHGSGNLRDRKNAPRVAAGSEDNGRVWLQALGHGGKLDRDVDPLQHSTKGLLLGADWSIDEEWRLGVMGGKSQTQMDSREFDGNLDSWHLGAYALRQNGPMSLRLGATYSSHDGNTARRVAFTGFSDRPKGNYDASTQQVFAEVGYNLGRANVSIEPFASLGYQRYQRDGYTEKGGAAALKVHDQAQSNMNSTVGLRLAKVDTLDNGMRLTPRFSAGWKHTYGDVYTQTRQRLVTGGSNYNVYGVELDRNSLLVDAGLDLGVSANHTVGVGLNGEIGSDSRNHGVMGQWRMAF